MKKILALALAGSAGTLCRYWLQGAVQRMMGTAFPWGTLVVNVAGCFAFGVIWSLAEERGLVPAEWRTVLLVGFMGAFTTFSSYIFENAQLIRDAEWLYTAAYGAGSLMIGYAGFIAGQGAARLI